MLITLFIKNQDNRISIIISIIKISICYRLLKALFIITYYNYLLCIICELLYWFILIVYLNITIYVLML